MNTLYLAVNIVGWIGSAAVIGAYLLISMNKLTAKSALYQLLNLIGAVGLVLNTGFHGAYPSAFVNAVWLIIAAFALKRLRSALYSKDRAH